MWTLVQQGGVTIWILLACSIWMGAIIIERAVRLRSSHGDAMLFLSRFERLVQEGRRAEARAFCEGSRAAIAGIAGAGLECERETPEGLRDTLRGAAVLQRHCLERNLPALGTIASSAPFIGLFGTVLGIMGTFRSLSLAMGNAMPDVSRGISEALIATAGGLGVAIVAVGAYNYFQTWLRRFDVDFEIVATEVAQLLRPHEEPVR